MPSDNPSSRPPATGDELAPAEHDRLDASADAATHLGAGPSADIGAGSRPRGEGEIPFDPDEPEPQIDSKPFDPLDGIPSVPPERIAGVPERQVTDGEG